MVHGFHVLGAQECPCTCAAQVVHGACVCKALSSEHEVLSMYMLIISCLQWVEPAVHACIIEAAFASRKREA
jgi:hypothetical protein